MILLFKKSIHEIFFHVSLRLLGEFDGWLKLEKLKKKLANIGKNSKILSKIFLPILANQSN